MRELQAMWMKAGKKEANNQTDMALGNTCAGRVINALTFFVIVICLGIWITTFLIIRNDWNMQTITGKSLTDLNCVVFFGGLVVTFTIGTLIGNFLRRKFWNQLVGRIK
jgi:hypothetical protein